MDSRLHLARLPNFISRRLNSYFRGGWKGCQQFICACWIFIMFSGSHRSLGSPSVNLTGTTTELVSAVCGKACLYEVIYQRAHCDQRGLTYVPIAIGCEGVSLLELQENDIKSVTMEHMSGYTRIRTIDISRNQISFFVPGTFLNNPQMTNFIASHNKLERILKDTFNGTEGSLQRIYLDNNKIQYIEQGTFFLLASLHTLSLQNNYLSEIPGGFFTGLFALKQVNLSYNQLHDIPPPVELGFPYLHVLDIRNNQLNKSAAIVPFLYNFTDDLYFSGNPIDCDCDFLKIQKWFYKTFHSKNNQIGCELGNGTYVDVKDSITVLCEGNGTNISPQEDTTTQAVASHRQTQTTGPFLNFTKGYVSSSHNYDDYNRPRKEIDHTELSYKVPWISYYTAVILTIYMALKFIKWVRTKKKNYKRNQEQV